MTALHPKTLEHVPVDRLTPYARNARTHRPEQVRQIAASITEFGFTNPVMIDLEGGIIAGHGRVMAAKQLGLATVPCLRLDHLTEAQKRAYIIADNQLALNAGWDDALLAIELGELKALEFDLDLTGMGMEEIERLLAGDFGRTDKTEHSLDSAYSTKIEAPIYEPKGENPPVADLTDTTKAQELRAEIDAANLSDDVRVFLHAAADRHTVFHFRRIAEFYAHAGPELQRLMERSALVIIDFDKAIENGFVALTERFGQIADIEEGAVHDA